MSLQATGQGLWQQLSARKYLKEGRLIFSRSFLVIGCYLSQGGGSAGGKVTMGGIEMDLADGVIASQLVANVVRSFGGNCKLQRLKMYSIDTFRAPHVLAMVERPQSDAKTLELITEMFIAIETAGRQVIGARNHPYSLPPKA